jgi:S-DNA-T family DNA segregation ATPase FtsK/SpoIIIE
MATQARRASTAADWRAALSASLLRAGQVTGALALFAAALFLALSLVSYQQTDPSWSTAAGGEVANWMGRPGAFAADRALIAFGFVSALFVPLLAAFGRKLWREAAAWEGGEPLAVPSPQATAPRRWWRTTALLLAAMALLATVLALATTPADWDLPASAGGLAGLFGEAGIAALAELAPPPYRPWTMLGLGVVALVAGTLLAARVFALDLAQLLTLPRLVGPRLRSRRGNRGERGDRDEEPARSLAARRAQRRAAPAPDTAETERRAPEISDPSAPPVRAQPLPPKQKDLFETYQLPSLDLLEDAPADKAPPLDKLALERNARLLEGVLDDFNVKGEVTAVRTGPVVTMYELEPAPGTKAVRVIGLAEDIARNMSAISARVSSIPGRTVMGIELPNARRQMVSFKELVASEAFAGNGGNLPMILGKDIAGEPIVADLAAMPHLLVAGTTGSGKSVGLNTILLSLLYRFTPAEVRLILIDPKVLELKTYDDIPHLLSPVVTEPAKAVRALKWAVEEMERRYRMMSDIAVRNLGGYNDKVRAAQAKGKPLGRRVQTGFDPETGEELIEEEQLDFEVLPQIVLIVDELADLMVTVGKEIEVLIQRLSQKSRAAGIHLIMATQRPSVDVITGVIKANLPTRISFHVTSRIDSRTIIGEQGAEQLLGKGDMLYKPSSGALIRVHGPFVSDEEVERVAQHWRGQGEPAYVDSVTEEPEDGGFGFEDDLTASDNPEERKYRQACQIVFEAQKASGSWLQRQMGVGYNTAAKWIERMEEDGFVGPSNHVGRREIFRDRDGNPL